MQNRFNVLQSGFISLENKLLLTPQSKESDLEFDAYILNKPYKDNENLYFYHKGIKDVFTEYNNDQRVSTSFAFQEKTILAFMNAISVPTFAVWIELQNDNPHLSALHTRFLRDTINFIAGEGRAMSAESWDLLIDKNNSFDKNSAEKIPVSDYFTTNDYVIERDGYDPYYIKPPKVPFKLSTMLQLWISRPMGFSDFIVTCNIIFGEKKDYKTV